MTTTPVPADKLAELRWAKPGQDVSPPVPLNVLLQSLQLLASDDARVESTKVDLAWDAPTPASMQVIRSGVLGVTKAGTKWVAGVGGGTGVVAAVAGVLTAFIGEVGEPITITLLASSAVLLSAVAVSLSIFVSGDLRARGTATAARHQGRAEVAAAFLEATGRLPQATASGKSIPTAISAADLLLTIAAFPNKVLVTTEQHKEKLVTGVNIASKTGRPRFWIDHSDWVDIEEIRDLKTG